MQWTIVVAVFLVGALSVSEAGVVEGAKACPIEGSSTFVEMRLVNHDPDEPDCTQAPCTLRTDNSSASYEVTLQFIAGESASDILFEIWFLRPNGGVTPLVSKTVDSIVENGQGYNAYDNFTIPVRFNNNPGDLSILIKNQETDSRIICGEFPVFVTDEGLP